MNKQLEEICKINDLFEPREPPLDLIGDALGWYPPIPDWIIDYCHERKEVFPNEPFTG